MFRMKFTPILGVLTLVSLTACGTTHTPAPSEAISDLASKTKISVVHYEPEQFTIWTGERKLRSTALGMFGLIGASIDAGMQAADAKEAGAKFISASQLTDPITLVETRFLIAWQRELGLMTIPAPQLITNDSIRNLQKQLGADYVVDFKTERWSIDPIISGGLSSEPIAYRTAYTGRARLIRLNDEKIVWEGTCKYEKDDSVTPKLTPYDITGGDQGVAVKASIQVLADTCADYLWRQFFGREVGPEIPPTTLTEIAK